MGNQERTNVPKGQVKRIAVIGGGASGAIVLDTLIKEGVYDEITVFERREKLGGVWVLDRKTRETPNDIVKPGFTPKAIDPPLRNPFRDASDPSKQVLIKKTPKQERFVETPSYEGIKTNIIEQLMTYSDENSWFPHEVKEDTKYVSGNSVQEYIHRYFSRHTQDDRVTLALKTTVEDIEKISKPDAEIPYSFRVTARSNVYEEMDIWWQEDFDAVIVATGHYHVPFIPVVEGLKEVQEKFKDVIQHAKFYREPTAYKGETVITIGSRSSGADITKQISPYANVVYQSVRNNTGIKKSKKENVKGKGVIKEYKIIDNNNFRVIFDDDTEITNPDHIIYGTGYQFSFPFLSRLFEEEGKEVSKDGIIIPDLYQHTFPIGEPLINFVGMPIDGVSFRVFEYQAILVSRYLSGKIELPSISQQKDWVADRLESKGLTRSYHTIGVTDAYPFLNNLVSLGKIKDPSVKPGREFPTFSEDDLKVYREAGEKLREFWDEY